VIVLGKAQSAWRIRYLGGIGFKMMMQSGILRPGEKTSSKKMVKRIMNKA